MWRKLIKDKSILDLLEHLEIKFGKNSFKIEDNWEADLCAIGITNPDSNYILYISTFNQKPNEYYLVLETKAPFQKLPYSSEEIFNNSSLAQLEKLIKDNILIN